MHYFTVIISFCDKVTIWQKQTNNKHCSCVVKIVGVEESEEEQEHDLSQWVMVQPTFTTN